MTFKRYYTQKNIHPFDTVKFTQRKAKYDSSGKKHIVMAPQSWSQTAVDIVSQKYLRKTDVPNDLKKETDFRELFLRLAQCWRYWGKKTGHLKTAVEARIFEEEILYMLVHQMAAPNSPQWFNTGLYQRYKIKGPAQGHWYYDEKKKKCVQSKSAYQRPQPHACFIQDVRDDLAGEDGIMELWQKEARLFKYGSGSGTNFSRLRSKGELLNSGGKSSGVLAFLKIGDQAAGAIKSGGTTRRAAKMVLLDIDHPDILDFIKWKRNEEFKVAALATGSAQLNYIAKAMKRVSAIESENEKSQARLDFEKDMKKRGLPIALRQQLMTMIKMGLDWETVELDESWEGLAYQTVSGQNSNNSVRIPHSFMQKLEKNQLWALRRRSDSTISTRIPSQSLWNELCLSSWSCADPGVQFHDTINEWNTCLQDGFIRASNPCSEYLFLDETACNLASLNVLSFFDERSKKFDHEGYLHAVHIWTNVLDISVSMAHYPSKEIAKRSIEYRTLGLGLTNIGAFLMRKGLAYDSDEARSWTQVLCSLMSSKSWLTSAELAQKLSPFKRYKKNKESILKVLGNHYLAAQGSKNGYKGLKIKPYLCQRFKSNEELYHIARELWEDALNLAKKSGVRNAQTTLLAPTGTISLVMDCDTTGIEPDYSLKKIKTLAGGAQISLINKSINSALQSMGLSSKKINEVLNHYQKNESFLGAPYLNEEQVGVFDCAKKDKKGRVLSPESHLLMVASAQPFLSGAVSKTINLPEDTNIDQISALYKRAHSLMIKAVSVFRDGSKLSWPLNSETHEQSQKTLEDFSCPFCQQKGLRQTGTCYVCESCGESTSCA